MFRVIFLVLLLCYLTGCSEKKTANHTVTQSKYPVIEICDNVGKYRKVYCSDYFSSLELIPLETNDNSLIGIRRLDNTVLVNDSLIFFISELTTGFTVVFPFRRILLVFNRAGNFLHQIGRIGQGPGDYLGISNVFMNPEKPTLFVDDSRRIIEYDFRGKFIDSFQIPVIDGHTNFYTNYVTDSIFIVFSHYTYKNSNIFHLFDRNGMITKSVHGHHYLETDFFNNWTTATKPFRIDDVLYIKDRINDTIYTFENLNVQPVAVFNLGKYAYPSGKTNEEGKKEIKNIDNVDARRLYMMNRDIVGMPGYFYYEMHFPKNEPVPRSRPEQSGTGSLTDLSQIVYGIFDREKKTNILLDTDHHGQKGFINDINGGLSIIPRYYAGNNEVIDIWKAEDMKEMLTEEYFASQTIKDKEAHQKLKALLKNLQEDDNPVVVIAKLK